MSSHLFAKMPSCLPYPGTIRIEEQGDKIYVRWACDTAGFHEKECSCREEAEQLRDRLEMEILVWWPVRWGDYPEEKEG